MELGCWGASGEEHDGKPVAAVVERASGGSGSSGGVAGAGRSGGVNSRGGHGGAEPQRLNLMAGRVSGRDAGPVDGSGYLGTSAALGAEVLTKSRRVRAEGGFRGRGTKGGSSRGAAVVVFLKRRRMLGLPRPDRPPVPAGWDSARVAGLQEQTAQAESASKKNDGIDGRDAREGGCCGALCGDIGDQACAPCEPPRQQRRARGGLPSAWSPSWLKLLLRLPPP